MKTSADEGVIPPPLRVREEWASTAWTLEPDEPPCRNPGKDRPSEARDKCRSGCSKKPHGRLYKQEHEWHKSKRSKKAQISPSAILTPRVGFHHNCLKPIS